MAEYLTLHTLEVIRKGKRQEIPPGVRITLDEKKDAEELKQFLKTKSITPYKAEDLTPPKFESEDDSAEVKTKAKTPKTPPKAGEGEGGKTPPPNGEGEGDGGGLV